jgi:hypothetical protein
VKVDPALFSIKRHSKQTHEEIELQLQAFFTSGEKVGGTK